MKALVYLEPKKISWMTTNNPEILLETDVIVKIKAFTFSHADYRPFLGQDNNVPRNLIMGHEGVGTIVAIGKKVKNIKLKDEVIINCITHCSNCQECYEKRYANCINGGFILGTKINGTHAEYVRVPYGDYSVTKVASSVPSEYSVMAADVLSTAYDNVISKINNKTIKNAVIIGDGPIGLATFLFLHKLNIKTDIYGHHYNKLEIFKKNGANNIYLENKNLNNKYNLVVEAVGNDRKTFELSQNLVSYGGKIITIGVFNQPVTLFLNNLWSQNISINTGILSNINLPIISKLIEKEINVQPLISKIYSKNEVIKAYNAFADKQNFKVVVKL